MANIVSRDVFSVLGELDAEAVKRALVQSGDKALDYEPGFEVELGDLTQYFRI